MAFVKADAYSHAWELAQQANRAPSLFRALFIAVPLGVALWSAGIWGAIEILKSATR